VKTALRILVPDPLLFAALAIAVERAQASRLSGQGPRLSGIYESPTGLVSVSFTEDMAYFTLGIATNRLEYDVSHDQVTLRKSDGSESMIFRVEDDTLDGEMGMLRRKQ
jgi:hypothetical protein